MKLFLLDTDTCVFYMRKRHNIAVRLASAGVWNCRISQITLMELKYGAECSDFSKLCHREIDDFCEYVSVVSICDEIIQIYASEKAKLRKSGTLIADFDLIIGATAIHHGWTVVTNNTKHFGRLPSLEIENWTR